MLGWWTRLRNRSEMMAGPSWPPGPGSPTRNGHAAGSPPASQADQPAAGSAGEVPRWLQQAAGWSWRLLLVAVVLYLTFRVASTLRLVVLPCIAALLLAALLQPPVRRLRRAGLPGLAATWCTLLIAVAVLAGAGVLAGTQTSADYPTLVHELGRSVHTLQRWLAGPPLRLRQTGLAQLADRGLGFLQHHQTTVAGTVVTGGRIFLQLLAGLILTVFVTFFLLKDGDRIWAWLLGFLSGERARRAGAAGTAAWLALGWYVRGTMAVAAIHAVVIGLALWILGVPLLVPLIILVFVAAFVPLVGILVAGALAVMVTLGTKGWAAALILLAVLVLENQVESHLLQPLLVGRMVRLHPLAIILVLALGGVIAGIPGAIIAVPLAAALSRAAPYLAGRELGSRAGPCGHGQAGPPAAAGRDGQLTGER